MADHHHQGYSFLFLVCFSCFAYTSYAYQFVVGGRDGWVVNPSENYNRWAERMRFQVNDTLLFKYKSGSDSVLVVNKDDYDKCYTANPILKLDDGNSIFKFDHSGPFYFITGNKDNCDQGQKLITVVLAVRNPPTPPSTTPSPAAAPPTGSFLPSPSPTAGGSPAPASSPFSPSPSSSGAPSPAGSPLSPYPAGEAPSPATNGGVSGPSPAATSSMPPSSATTPGSPNFSTPASGTTPADVNSTGGSTPRNLAAPSCTPAVVLVSLVGSLVFSVGLGGFVVSS